jgi:hypothetical protein
MLNATDLQCQTLRLYGELVCRCESFAGQLVMCCCEGSSASGLPAAVSIAGGTTLALDPDAAAVKAVFRQGGIDFVVNTLDEALRVLKNEIRQRKPLSVGLISPLETVLEEMIERGVLPDLEVQIGDAAEFEYPELRRLGLGVRDGIVEPSEFLSNWLDARGWVEGVLPVASTGALRAMDVKLLGLLAGEDKVRRAWLERIAHYQRPVAGGSRVVWLTAAERAAL